MRTMMPGMRLVLVFGTVLMTVLVASSQSDMIDQMTTPERLRQHLWWPTKLSSAPDKFVGNGACAACHAAIVKSQATSEMAQTLMAADQSHFLTSRYGKQVTVDGFVYRIFRGPEGPAFQVVSSTAPI